MKKLCLFVVTAMLAWNVSGCTQSTNQEETSSEEQGEQSQGETDTSQAKEENTTQEVNGAIPPRGTEGILQAELPSQGEEIAVVKTNQGEIKIRFYPEEAPKAVENFKSLAQKGYYDGITFHRVINNFMIQGGDPQGNGTGGESIWGKNFEDELSPKLHFYRGALAMANAGPNTNGSQFFIVQNPKVNEQALQAIEDALADGEEINIPYTAGEVNLRDAFPENVIQYYQKNGGSIELEYAFGNPYTIFGQVFEGMETVDTIASVETDENDKPLEDVIIESISFEPYQ